MVFILFMTGPPFLVLAVLAALAPGRPAAIGLGIFAIAAIGIGIFFYARPSQPPSGYFAHNLELIPYLGAVGTGCVVAIAQIWRFARLKYGQPTHYLWVLAGLTALMLIIYSTVLF